MEFNKMLRGLCYDYNCVYVDFFRNFLAADERDFNPSLYRDWLHLNWDGKVILCNWFKYIIEQTSYNLTINRLAG